jgi:hypothetical protein
MALHIGDYKTDCGIRAGAPPAAKHGIGRLETAVVKAPPPLIKADQANWAQIFMMKENHSVRRNSQPALSPSLYLRYLSSSAANSQTRLRYIQC